MAAQCLYHDAITGGIHYICSCLSDRNIHRVTDTYSTGSQEEQAGGHRGDNYQLPSSSFRLNYPLSFLFSLPFLLFSLVGADANSRRRQERGRKKGHKYAEEEMSGPTAGQVSRGDHPLCQVVSFLQCQSPLLRKAPP